MSNFHLNPVIEHKKSLTLCQWKFRSWLEIGKMWQSLNSNGGRNRPPLLNDNTDINKQIQNLHILTSTQSDYTLLQK